MKKKIIKIIGTMLRIVFSYSLKKKLHYVKVNIHTEWVSSEFMKIGEQVKIEYPTEIAGGKCIRIGNKVSLGKRMVLTAWEKYKNSADVYYPIIEIGDNTFIGDDCHITCINKIIIESNVLIGKKVLITDNSHGTSDYNSLLKIPIERNLYSAGAIIIEEGVWIGEKSTILANVKIGKNSIIGANSVVTKDIPSNSVAVGTPAIVIKTINN